MYTLNEKLVAAFLAILAISGAVGPVAAEDAVTLELAAGDYDRQGTIAAVELPAALAKAGNLTLTRLGDNRPIAVQVQPGDKPKAVWIVRDKLPAGKTRGYRLAVAKGKPAEKCAVSVEDDGKHLVVEIGGKHVFSYNHAVVPSPNPKTPYYAKSGHIHPLFDPAGRLLTDDFNPDHAHQHGIMFAWRKTLFEGRHTNGWDQKTGSGKVEHVKVEATGCGPVLGFFDARLRQVDLTAPGGPKPVLNESWLVTVYNFADHYLFDIQSTQTCAGPSPLEVEEIHYGGMTIRAAASWCHGTKFDYTTNEGKTRVDGNHSRPAWVDIQGPLLDLCKVDARSKTVPSGSRAAPSVIGGASVNKDGTSGVTIMDHPSNFRFPQPVRMHPTMPYFCFVPAHLGSFKIEPGKPYVSRYRFYVHEGKLEKSQIERLWNDYAHPAEVRVVSE